MRRGRAAREDAAVVGAAAAVMEAAAVAAATAVEDTGGGSAPCGISTVHFITFVTKTRVLVTNIVFIWLKYSCKMSFQRNPYYSKERNHFSVFIGFGFGTGIGFTHMLKNRKLDGA